MEEEPKEPQDAEILPPEKVKSQVPMSLEELASLQLEGQEIIQARVKILETLRTASIRATHPSDWLLFKNLDGAETGYLQDAGCKRVSPLWGIQITPNNGFERIPAQVKEGEEFAYAVRGDGHCNITGQFVRDIEGVRTSKDDFITRQKPPVTGIMLDVRVRQAARANLDGNIVRKLSGLQSVPRSELDAAWKDSGKNSSKCNYGRGYGSAAERRGAKVQDAPGHDAGPAPTCPVCKLPGMRFKPAGETKDGRKFGAFWGCQDWPACKGTMKDAEWKAKQSEPVPEERQPGEDDR